MNIDNILPQLFQRLDKTFWPNEAIWTTPLIKMALLTSALRSIGIQSHLVECSLRYGNTDAPKLVHRGTLYALRVEDRLLNLRDHQPVSWEDLARAYVSVGTHWVNPVMGSKPPQGFGPRLKKRLRTFFSRLTPSRKFWELESEIISPNYDMEPFAAGSSNPQIVSFSRAETAQAHTIAAALVLEQDTAANGLVVARARL